MVDDVLYLFSIDQQSLKTSFRKPGAPDDLFYCQCALRHVGGVFEKPDIARCKCWGGKAEDLPEWKIPGHHGQNGANRLVHYHASRRARLNDLIRQKALGILRVVPASPRAFDRLVDCRFKRLSHLEYHQAPESILLSFQYLRSLQQHSRSVPQPSRPKSAVGVCRALDACVQFRVGERCEGSDRLASCRVDGGDSHGATSRGAIIP